MCTVEHDFYGHEVNVIYWVNGKKCYDRAFHLVNKLHDFTGMHYLSGKFCYDDFFRKNHARLYFESVFRGLALKNETTYYFDDIQSTNYKSSF